MTLPACAQIPADDRQALGLVLDDDRTCDIVDWATLRQAARAYLDAMEAEGAQPWTGVYAPLSD